MDLLKRATLALVQMPQQNHRLCCGNSFLGLRIKEVLLLELPAVREAFANFVHSAEAFAWIGPSADGVCPDWPQCGWRLPGLATVRMAFARIGHSANPFAIIEHSAEEFACIAYSAAYICCNPLQYKRNAAL